MSSETICEGWLKVARVVAKPVPKGIAGWLACTDHIRAWEGCPTQHARGQNRRRRHAQPAFGTGPVLQGEVVLEADDVLVAWHLRGAHAYHFQLGVGEAAPEGNVTRVRFVRRRYLSTWQALSMAYRECWRKSPEDGIGVWRPWISIFAGWEGSIAG